MPLLPHPQVVLPGNGFVLMHSHAAHHQRDAGDLGRRRYLAYNYDADHRGGGRQQGEQQREARAGQARHRQLVTDVRDDRGAVADV